MLAPGRETGQTAVIDRILSPLAVSEVGSIRCIGLNVSLEAAKVVVLGKTAKNVSEADAMEYVLGYTAANDVSSRSSQFAQTQWSFSKGFDGACPIGKRMIGVAWAQ